MLRRIVLALAAALTVACCPSHSQYPAHPVWSVADSVVALVDEDHIYCTAEWISPDLLLTAAHCTQDGPNLTYVTRTDIDDPIRLTATVVRADTDLDLAVLHASITFEHPFLTRGNVPAYESTVMFIGHPIGIGWTVSHGWVAGVRRRAGVQLLQIEGPVWFGNSGGPVLDADGHLIGVVSFLLRDLPGYGFAVGPEAISKFLGVTDSQP